jgi:selenide,water dikinase
MKRLLLVGAGHSQLAVLKALGDAPVRGRVTLLCPHRHAVYSGMVPGVVAGHYGAQQCRVDVVALAARAGIGVVEDAAVGIDVARRAVLTAGGRRLPYDLLSLDVGSTANAPDGDAGRMLRMRPVGEFLADWDRLRQAIRRGAVRRVAVVGGGAAGVETLLAMRHASTGTNTEFSLVSDELLAGHSPAVRRRMERILAARGVAMRMHEKVVAMDESGLALERGRHLDADASVWATGARAQSWIAASGLACDAQGFVSVGDTLQSDSHPEVFAAGDCASRAAGGPKSGVIAVRQGPVLAQNLRRALAGAAPQPFHAPSRTLALISCGGRYAVASWGSLALAGGWVWRWKDHIDRRFVEGYRVDSTPRRSAP